ncbi:glucose 1-dehydrogenase [Metallosphaera tengchongensis]|uniref:Glucose 1-dehydrogenase n=1 Tax=Metallosphaera tengchongensis TaxID=1532350 RepID=A0A6N0NT31_9CREN|nr:glucose 1-dehydrogenase [Metallosphaera tengchongensis]QKQ99062.1 glucose 1-dehydrogenase [Metallosphaera tengchongensis]
MKAIVVTPQKPGVDIREIEIQEKGEIRVMTRLSGLCGTDRGIVNGDLDFARPPPGNDYLVLGHETLGEVVEGNDRLRKGDLVVPVVRRGCGECLNCKVGHQDFCETGKFTEIGIRGAHGTMREEFWDSEENLVKVAPSIGEIGVLLEPLSNVVKATRELESIQRRMLWRCEDSTYQCRTAVVLGSGPIGLLFSLTLKTMGFNVIVANRRPPSSVEEEIVKATGSIFINTSSEQLPEMDLLVDTSGHPSAFVPLLQKIRKNGALVLFGTTGKERAEITAEDVTRIVENNVVIMGSVNASKDDFQQGGNLLVTWKEMYGEVMSKFITRKVSVEEAPEVLEHKVPGEIKTVIKWK